MADLLPLRGLRYQSSVAGDLGNVIAPPYDVISEEAQHALYDRSPFNVVRLEYGADSPAGELNRYQQAAHTLASWRRQGVLASDPRASYYLYEQEFQHGERTYRRRSIFGRVRLEPWEKGVILPHEHTMIGPKQDRLRLLRACRANVSPIFSLYRPDGGQAIGMCEAAVSERPDVDARDSTGHRHRLWVVVDTLAVQRLQRHFSPQTLYVADGHHRYETALAYLDERRSAESVWSGDEPENFVLMALTAADDPGLLILPIHRLVRPVHEPADLRQALSRFFAVRDWNAAPSGSEPAPALVRELEASAALSPSLAILGLASGPAVAALSDRKGVEALMPSGHSEAWRGLSVNILQYGILDPLLGIGIETVRSGEYVSFTESADEAMRSIDANQTPLAFLLNATRPEEIFAVADAGDRMPQKSTFFFPKLGTGLVLYSMDP